MLSKNRVLILLYVLLFTLGVAGCAKKGGSDAENFPKSEEEEDLEGEFLSQGKEIDINLTDIFFDYDQSGLNAGSRVILDQNADIINSKASTLQAVIVEGYCDTRGTDTYNLALGQRRADSVKSYLVKAGVPSSLVQAVSKGETDRWASGSSESAYQENRRAHFVALAN